MNFQLPSILTEKHTWRFAVIFEFGLSNFYSFKEGASVSFRLDANCPEHISQGFDFAHVLCVKGANASGKTHLLKSLAFLSWFCTSSFSIKPDDRLPVLPFFESQEPSDFYVEFSTAGETYRYEASLTCSEVRKETLYRLKPKRLKLFERINNRLASTTQKLERLKTMQLRSNASIISTANQYAFTETADFYKFFENSVANVTVEGLGEPKASMEALSKLFHENPALLQFVTAFIADCDAGVSDIRIRNSTSAAGETTYSPIFIHKSNGKEHEVEPSGESSGTKALFQTLHKYASVVASGGILILDEFDVYLHPHILPKLLDLFLNQETNAKHAQIIFTTHSAEVLNLLGRYRTYLVNKEDNESYAFRLDEIKGDILRNDRSIVPAYNEGKIGGVPRL